jgi:enoyl-CoA hydratase/carnithine racemase
VAYQTIIHERKNQTAWIYLNRPEEMNSISKTLLTELVDVLQEVEQDESVRVIVLSGKEKAFCAGADLKELLGESRMSDTFYVKSIAFQTMNNGLNNVRQIFKSFS